MYLVKIGNSQKSLSDATESWIVHHVQQRKEDGRAVCVQVILKDSSIDMILSTPACGGGGSGRRPNAKEQKIIGLWSDDHLNERSWTVGDLVAFLRQLRSLL